MNRFSTWPGAVFAAAALMTCCLPARADGLADLKAALARLPAQTPVRASLELKTLERRGEDNDLDEKIGEASVLIEDGAHGLQMTYPKDTRDRMDAESRQLGRDATAKTPTLSALAKLDASEYPAMLSAVPALQRALDESTFKGERAEQWQGKPARVLSFAVPATKLPSQQRKYVKQFDGVLDIWIAADGTPLASRERDTIAGRAFIVVSFQGRDDEDCSFAVVGDRLVTLRKDVHLTSSGAGEHGEQRVVKTLQLLP